MPTFGIEAVGNSREYRSAIFINFEGNSELLLCIKNVCCKNVSERESEQVQTPIQVASLGSRVGVGGAANSIRSVWVAGIHLLGTALGVSGHQKPEPGIKAKHADEGCRYLHQHLKREANPAFRPYCVLKG